MVPKVVSEREPSDVLVTSSVLTQLFIRYIFSFLISSAAYTKRDTCIREFYTRLGRKTKMGVWLFFKIGLCTVISFKRSRRELPINVA